ncbi:MAG: YraN family protein [Clostridium sp.]|nr:YraN family protein [Clostridium sp.]
MSYNKTIGRYGENIAANYLINNGYKILNRNFQTRYGEVDIIGHKDDIIIFFEIKSRYTDSFGAPLESVTCYKQGKIISISSYYIYINNLYNYNIRYDVIEIIFNHLNDTYKINHLIDAFRTY